MFVKTVAAVQLAQFVAGGAAAVLRRKYECVLCSSVAAELTVFMLVLLKVVADIEY